MIYRSSQIVVSELPPIIRIMILKYHIICRQRRRRADRCQLCRAAIFVISLERHDSVFVILPCCFHSTCVTFLDRLIIHTVSIEHTLQYVVRLKLIVRYNGAIVCYGRELFLSMSQLSRPAAWSPARLRQRLCRPRPAGACVIRSARMDQNRMLPRGVSPGARRRHALFRAAGLHCIENCG